MVHSKVYTRLLLASLPLMLLALAVSMRVFASSRLVVTLVYFRATEADNGVLLEWATGSEVGTVGFKVERADAQAGPYVSLTGIGFVPANGDVFGGGTYSRVDTTADVGGQVRTYWYRLLEVDVSGNENPELPVAVTVGTQGQLAEDPTATATPQPTSETSNQEATATPEPSSTPALSALVDAQAQATRAIASVADATDPTSLVADNNTSNLAQEETPEAGGAYPLPATPEPAEEADSPTLGYPSPGEPRLMPDVNVESESDDSLSGQAAPAGIPVNGTPVVTRIGSNLSTPELPATAAQAAEQSVGPVLFLWLGFLASLLIFAVGVVGSALFFTRHRTRGN
jgi:hypothetical protein